MERRDFLASSSAAFAMVVAGCSGNDDGTAPDEAEDDDGDGETDTTQSETGDGEISEPTASADNDEDQPVGEPSTLDRLSTTWDTYVSDPVVLSGSENSTETFTLRSGFTAIGYEFTGYELYARLMDSDGNHVRTINELDGGSGFDGVPVEEGEYTFEVEADGEWQLELGSPETSSTTLQRPPASVQGTGNDVVGPIELDGGETIAVTHDGRGDFIVDSVHNEGTGDEDTEAVANAFSGPYEDETTLSQSGIRWFPIYASGPWEIDIE